MSRVQLEKLQTTVNYMYIKQTNKQKQSTGSVSREKISSDKQLDMRE